MNRAEFEAIGDLHKRYEGMNQHTFMDALPIMVRLDGRGFSKLTKGLNKPFDDNFKECMHFAATEVLKEANALISYVQSDEITIIIPSNSGYFGYRRSKIETILASTATAAFIIKAMELFPNKAKSMPKFDARAWQYPNFELCVDSLRWREADCSRNSISMLCQAHFGPSTLNGVGTAGKHELLHSIGINWNDLPVHYKRGTYYAKRATMMAIPDDVFNSIPVRNRPETNLFSRNNIIELEMGPIGKVSNMFDVVFNGGMPNVGNL